MASFASNTNFSFFEDSFIVALSALKQSITEKNAQREQELHAEVKDLIKQMEMEARSSEDPTVKKALQDKIVRHKRSLTQVNEEAQRSNVIGTKSSADQRQRLQDANDQLLRQNELLANAQRTVAATEDIGTTISAELLQNRGKIEASSAKVASFSSITEEAKGFVKRMDNREKCVLS